MAASEHCREHHRTLPLEEVIAAARARDVEVGVVALSVIPACSDGATRFYLELPSATAAYLPELHSLYPTARWVFVYRVANAALAKAAARPRCAASNAPTTP